MFYLSEATEMEFAKKKKKKSHVIFRADNYPHHPTPHKLIIGTLTDLANVLGASVQGELSSLQPQIQWSQVPL